MSKLGEQIDLILRDISRLMNAMENYPHIMAGTSTERCEFTALWLRLCRDYYKNHRANPYRLGMPIPKGNEAEFIEWVGDVGATGLGDMSEEEFTNKYIKEER